MKILLTGANGFVGRHLLDRLAGTHELFALVRQVPMQPLTGVEYITQDLGEQVWRTKSTFLCRWL